MKQQTSELLDVVDDKRNSYQYLMSIASKVLSSTKFQLHSSAALSAHVNRQTSSSCTSYTRSGRPALEVKGKPKELEERAAWATGECFKAGPSPEGELQKLHSLVL